MSLRRALVAASATVLTVGALLAPSASAAPQAPAVPTAPAAPTASAATGSFRPAAPAWGTCASTTLQRFNAQCAKIEVPLDYDKPGGTKIKLAISRVVHTTKDYQGVMLTNPGGPGGSGLVLSVYQNFVPDDAGRSYDWIGFDPRGVGDSEPSVTCDPTYYGYDRPPYVPSSPAVLQAWFDRSNAYTDACAQKNGPILEHLTTLDTVKDMESIRKSLGEKKINFYGFSYGTYLGQVYATKYPDRLRRAVFDGTVDPREVWYEGQLSQDLAFDPNMNRWFAWVAAHDGVYHLGTTEAAVRLTFYRTQDKLDANPAQTPYGGFGGDEWNDTFLQAGYYVYGWVDLAQAFADYVNDGDISGAETEFGYDPTDPQADNGNAVYLGVQCTDTSWPQSWSRWERDAWRAYQEAPYETWNNVWFNEQCRHWPAASQKPVTIKKNTKNSVLMIGEQYDAATPFDGSLYVRKLFTKARLIEGVGGTTHAGSLSGVDCTDNRIADYLATGKLPDRRSGNRADVKCDPVPAPEPSDTSASRSVQRRSADTQTRAELRRVLAEAQVR